jgi:hypothetical protein
MNESDLKQMWNEAQKARQKNVYESINIEKSIERNHCEAVTKIIADVKWKIALYVMVLAILMGLTAYAFLYLKLHLSLVSIIAFIFTGLFLIIRTSTEIIRLLILTKTSGTFSLRESLIFYRRQLNTIRAIDFYSYMFFFYVGCGWIGYNLLHDTGGLTNLLGQQSLIPLSMILILMGILILIPWFIRYQFNQRYKKVYEWLKDSLALLNDTR